jgi:hypothetical protein
MGKFITFLGLHQSPRQAESLSYGTAMGQGIVKLLCKLCGRTVFDGHRGRNDGLDTGVHEAIDLVLVGTAVEKDQFEIGLFSHQLGQALSMTVAPFQAEMRTTGMSSIVKDAYPVLVAGKAIKEVLGIGAFFAVDFDVFFAVQFFQGVEEHAAFLFEQVQVGIGIIGKCQKYEGCIHGHSIFRGVFHANSS